MFKQEKRWRIYGKISKRFLKEIQGVLGKRLTLKLLLICTRRVLGGKFGGPTSPGGRKEGKRDGGSVSSVKGGGVDNGNSSRSLKSSEKLTEKKDNKKRTGVN